MASLLIGLAMVVAAILIGELLYRWRTEPARALADAGQALYYGFIVLTLLLVGIVIGGGKSGVIIAGLLTFTFWMFRTRVEDTFEHDWLGFFGFG